MTIIYHNPRCSKSRQALALIRERGIEPSIELYLLYLETPPSAAALAALLAKLGLNARQLLRSGEDLYKTLGLANSALSEKDLIAAMVEHPKLIERPIVVHGDKAIIGRPPELVLEILQ
jgi:arsenate reductase